MNINFKNILYLIVFYTFNLTNAIAETDTLKLQSTTSTRDSGLYEYIIPRFESIYNVRVHVIAVGTGQAIQNAKNCDADILIVHATDLEEKFIRDGYGLVRTDLMYNDFVIIGPKNDPASIFKATNARDALALISKSSAKFISRGDSSGTHLSERKIWSQTNIQPLNHSGDWYLESGQGMGSTLNIAVGMNAYTYADRSTWLRFNNKSNHKILFENDENLHNQYGVVKINPAHCKNINHYFADKLYEWLISQEGQELINEFTVNNEQLFKANSINNN